MVTSAPNRLSCSCPLWALPDRPIRQTSMTSMTSIMASPQTISDILSSIRDRAYVKAISLVDLRGDHSDGFVIRASLAAIKGSNVRFLLESYLIDQFVKLISDGSSDQSRTLTVLVEIVVCSNLFLDTEISCERLAEKCLAIRLDSGGLARRRVKFASNIPRDDSSGSSEPPEDEESFWSCLSIILDQYGQTRPFLKYLVEHVLVNLRGYVQDYTQYQEFADQIASILRGLRSSPVEPSSDSCECPKHLIPVFLAACAQDHADRGGNAERTDSSSVSSSSTGTNSLRTEHVHEFWTRFRRDPPGVFSILLDRIGRSIEAMQPIGDSMTCLCQCHADEWRRRMMERMRRETGIDELSIRAVLELLVSKMRQVQKLESRGGSLNLTVEDILEAVTGSSAISDGFGSDRRPSMNGTERDRSQMPSRTHSLPPPRFEPLDESDEETSVWSAGSGGLPLQPQLDDLLDGDRLDSGSDRVFEIDRKELAERKKRFNLEVLALQRRTLGSSSSTETYGPSNTDSDLESLPSDHPRAFGGPEHKPGHPGAQQGSPNEHDRVPAITPIGLPNAKTNPPHFRRPKVRAKPKDPNRVTIDRATSPCLVPHPAPKMETASQTGLQIDHAVVQTDRVPLQDTAVMAEPAISESGIQTESNEPPSILNGLINQKQDQFLHVQTMTKRDVQRIFRSAQAFANIC